MDSPLLDLKPEVKAVRSPARVVFSFPFEASLKLQAHGLRGSLLPHREDSIRDLDSLLAPVINFEVFYIGHFH